jgi:hypothetical protein
MSKSFSSFTSVALSRDVELLGFVLGEPLEPPDEESVRTVCCSRQRFVYYWSCLLLSFHCYSEQIYYLSGRYTCGIVSRWILLKGRLRVRKSNARWRVQEQQIGSWKYHQTVSYMLPFLQLKTRLRHANSAGFFTCLDSKHTGWAQAQARLSSPGMAQAPVTVQTQWKNSQALNNASTHSTNIFKLQSYLNLSFFKNKRINVRTDAVS